MGRTNPPTFESVTIGGIEVSENLGRRLVQAIEKHRKRIVVIGDTMVDRWVRGRVEECQDGCPKFMQEEVVEVPGGAGNAHRCLSNWDVKASVYGFVGMHCPVKTRYVDQNDKILMRVDLEAQSVGRRVIAAGYKWCRDSAMGMIEFAGGVLLSDYDKGFLTPEFIKEVVAACRSRRIPCVADCKRAPEGYEGAILKANQEWSRTNGDKVPNVLTRGPYAPLVDSKSFVGVETGKRPITCVNHVGAGDCFAAHLTLALAYGFSLKEAAALAHSAGRVYVQYRNNRPPFPNEVIEDLDSVS